MSLGVEDLDQVLAQFQRPTPELVEAMRKFALTEQAEMVRMRRQLWFWAPMVCQCTPWYEKGSPNPPQLHCPLHGHRQLMADGVLR